MFQLPDGRFLFRNDEFNNATSNDFLNHPNKSSQVLYNRILGGKAWSLAGSRARAGFEAIYFYLQRQYKSDNCTKVAALTMHTELK